MRGIAKLERTRTGGKRPYLLRGLMRCGVCLRKMQAEGIRNGVYYRCIARTLTPGSAALVDHPKTVNLREDHVVPALNKWLGTRFSRDNVDDTEAELIGSQDATVETGKHESAKQRLADAETRLKRHTAAIAAGVDPAALVEAINDAQADREAARAELAAAPAEPTISEAEVRALVDKLGDVGTKIETARPERLPEIYAEMGLELRFEQKERAVYVTARPRVFNDCVREERLNRQNRAISRDKNVTVCHNCTVAEANWFDPHRDIARTATCSRRDASLLRQAEPHPQRARFVVDLSTMEVPVDVAVAAHWTNGAYRAFATQGGWALPLAAVASVYGALTARRLALRRRSGGNGVFNAAPSVKC